MSRFLEFLLTPFKRLFAMFSTPDESAPPIALGLLWASLGRIWDANPGRKAEIRGLVTDAKTLVNTAMSTSSAFTRDAAVQYVMAKVETYDRLLVEQLMNQVLPAWSGSPEIVELDDLNVLLGVLDQVDVLVKEVP
jgi:hypothetical protein